MRGEIPRRGCVTEPSEDSARRGMITCQRLSVGHPGGRVDIPTGGHGGLLQVPFFLK